MKKTILSLGLIGILTTGAMAADTQALTKATVKLIKSDSETKVALNKIFNELNQKTKTDSNLSVLIKDNKNDISANKLNIEKNTKNTKNNFVNISELQNKFKSVSDTANNAIRISNDTRDIVNKINTITLKVEKDSNLTSSNTITINNSVSVLQTKIQNLKDKIFNIEKELDSANKQISENNKKIESLKRELTESNLQVQNNKKINDGRYKEIKEGINSMKIYYDTELKVIKAKLDKVRPIIISKPAKPVVIGGECTTGKCAKEITKKDEQLLNEFLRK